MKGKILATALAAGAGAAVAANVTKKDSDYSFMDKSVVIAGGSRGLGLIMARLLADEGARVTILARNQEGLDRAVEDISLGGGDVLAFRCDVTNRHEVENTMRRVIEHRGRIDVLINNAGIIQVGPVEHMQLQDFEDAMKVHMWGPLYAMQAVIPHMKREGGGRIVNISSIGGKIAVPHLLPYSASKFALTGFSEGLRAELKKDNVYVTTVCPGLMRTGSPPNADFKGQHRAEYAWFSISDSLPVSTIQAERAARQIIQGCRRGDAEVILSMQAVAAVKFHQLFPELSADIRGLVNRLLPAAAGGIGQRRAKGRDSQSELSPSWLTALGDEAAKRNNETGS